MPDSLIIFTAQYVGWILAAVYIFVLIWQPSSSRGRVLGETNWREEIIFVLTSVLTTWVLVQIIKMAYPSPRPFLELDNFTPLLKFGGNESFPSGHAAVLFAFGFAVYSYRKVYANIIILGAALVGAARVAAGLHWPSDILGGFVLAGLVVFILRLIFNRLRLQVRV